MALKRRDEEAIRRLSVGDSAIFEPPSGQALQGQIITIGRSRVVIAVRSDQDGFLQRVSVPAGLVRRVQ
jgi:hypothetical protein